MERLQTSTSEEGVGLIRLGIQSALLSKINITQGIAAVAMLLTMFGLEVPAEVQAQVVSVIVGVTTVATWVLRTWFTKTVTPAVATQLIKEKIVEDTVGA